MKIKTTTGQSTPLTKEPKGGNSSPKLKGRRLRPEGGEETCARFRLQIRGDVHCDWINRIIKIFCPNRSFYTWAVYFGYSDLFTTKCTTCLGLGFEGPVPQCQSPQFWWSRSVRSRDFSRPVSTVKRKNHTQKAMFMLTDCSANTYLKLALGDCAVLVFSLFLQSIIRVPQTGPFPFQIFWHNAK